MVVDYATTGEARAGHRNVEEWWTGKGPMDNCDPPEYLRPRYEALMERYRKSNGTLRIADLVLPSPGKEAAVYLTVLLKAVGREFHGVFSAFRYG
jgi:hypothetical protein